MRILVTGVSNPTGAAVVRALAKAGHEVRAFGVPADAEPFHGLTNVATFPGDLSTGGSVEPVASECAGIVHCAAMDGAGDDVHAQSIALESGTRYLRYAAEREFVKQFIAVLPAAPARGLAAAVQQAEAHVRATRANVPHRVLRVTSADEAVRQVVAALGEVAVAA